jgi:predicted Zn finger-like uncharacterized protein
MAISISCPNCRSMFRVLEEMQGRTVRCKVCQEPFTARETRENAGLDDRRPTREERLQSSPRSDPPPLPPRRGDNEERDARPSRSRRRDEEDDYRPQKSRRDERGASGVSSGLLIGGVIAGGVLLIAVVLGIVLLLAFSGSSPQPVASVGLDDRGKAMAPAEEKAPDGAGLAAPADVPPNAGVPDRPAVPPPAGPDLPGVGGRTALRYRWQGGPQVYTVRVEVEKENAIEIHEGICVIRPSKLNRGAAPPAEPRKGTGTGFVVNADGYLMTCAHVVADAVKIDVAVGGRSYKGTVLAIDHEHDLALVQIPARGLPTLPIGNSDSAELGLEVRALGYPLSSILGDNLKATRGTLSGINKKNGRKVFQIDAAVNPGNSGGPVVTEMGDVIGVTSAKLSGDVVSNVGFATPSNEAKRMLTAKGVSFETVASTTRLDGPTLVRRTSPSVALITVTLGQRADAELYQLVCQSTLRRSERPREGGIAPGATAPGRLSTNVARIAMDSSGRVHKASGGTQLPLLLGEVAMFLIEPMPPDDRPTWEMSGTCTIEESSGTGAGPRNPFGRPFGPGGGMPGGRMRPPFRPGRPGLPTGPATGTSKRQAHERSFFRRGEKAGDVQSIRKRYEMKTDPTAGAAASLNLSGEGEIALDTKDGLPREVGFKGTFAVTGGGANVRVPLAVTYKLLGGAERERALNAAAASAGPAPGSGPGTGGPVAGPAGGQKALMDAEVTQVLADLKSGDRNRCRSALNLLIGSKPTIRRDEVAKALIVVLEQSDVFTRKPCLEATGIWGTNENVSSLLGLLDDKSALVRWDVMSALGKIGDDRASDPIAKRLATLQDRAHASKALQSMGSKAENAVQSYLTHADASVRVEACKILKEIGTRASSAALAVAANDKNRRVQTEAKQAIAAIAGRS